MDSGIENLFIYSVYSFIRNVFLCGVSTVLELLNYLLNTRLNELSTNKPPIVLTIREMTMTIVPPVSWGGKGILRVKCNNYTITK